MCRETVREIGGGDWKGPSADSREVVRWNNAYALFNSSLSVSNKDYNITISWSDVDDWNLSRDGTSATRVK